MAYITDFTKDIFSGLKNGTMFIASAGPITLALNARARLTFANPSNSGKRIYIYATALTTGVTTLTEAVLSENPTTGLPSGIITPINQNRGSSNASVAVINADVNLLTSLGGGTSLMTIPVVGNTRNIYDKEFLVIPPGKTLGLNLQGIVALTMYARLYFFEETI